MPRDHVTTCDQSLPVRPDYARELASMGKLVVTRGHIVTSSNGLVHGHQSGLRAAVQRVTLRSSGGAAPPTAVDSVTAARAIPIRMVDATERAIPMRIVHETPCFIAFRRYPDPHTRTHARCPRSEACALHCADADSAGPSSEAAGCKGNRALERRFLAPKRPRVVHPWTAIKRLLLQVLACASVTPQTPPLTRHVREAPGGGWSRRSGAQRADRCDSAAIFTTTAELAPSPGWASFPSTGIRGGWGSTFSGESEAQP
jgi:hypothetical protein